MPLPRYKYEDLHPKHECWKIAEYWGTEEQELVTDTDLNDAIEYILDGVIDPICDMDTIEVYGYEDYPDCPECDMPEEGTPIRESCIIEVDVLAWVRENQPDWLEE